MPKGVFQMRNGLSQLAMAFAIGFLPCFLAGVRGQDVGDAAVFWHRHAVGRLGFTAERPCDGCYTIHKLNVFGKEVQILLPVSVVSVNGSRKFNADYAVQEQDERDTRVLTLQSNYTSECIRLVFSGMDGGRMQSIQRTANASYRHRVAGDEYVDLPSTRICRREFRQTQAIPRLLDFRNSDMPGERAGDCFACPAYLAIDKCLEMKKDKIPFEWK